MAAFQFPDPAVQQTVINPITGSTYQWKNDPGKWVVTVSVRNVEDIIAEGDNPPIPRGDYKLWYSTDLLELYFWYEDANGNGAWVPTSAPITMLEDLDTAVSELRTDIYKVNIATSENENRIGRTVEFSDTAPTIYPDTVYDGVPYPNELNFKFWYDTSRLELLILFRDEDGDDSYVPVSIPLESLPEPGVSQETFTYTTGNLHTAIQENYVHNLKQDLLIEDLQRQIDEMNRIKTTRVLLQYLFDSVLTNGTFGTNNTSSGMLTTILFGGTTFEGEELPVLKVGDKIALTGLSLGGRLVLNVTEVKSPKYYGVTAESNSSTFNHKDNYLVSFIEIDIN